MPLQNDTHSRASCSEWLTAPVQGLSNKSKLMHRSKPGQWSHSFCTITITRLLMQHTSMQNSINNAVNALKTTSLRPFNKTVVGCIAVSIVCNNSTKPSPGPGPTWSPSTNENQGCMNTADKPVTRRPRAGKQGLQMVVVDRFLRLPGHFRLASSWCLSSGLCTAYVPLP